MTQQNRTTNKGKFEQGDKPQGSDYVDLIDSYVSLADTTAQSVSSPMTVTGSLGASTTVSAVSVEASAGEFRTITTSALAVSGDVVIQGDLDVQGTLQFTQTDTGEFYLDATAAVSASATYIEPISTVSALPVFLVNFEATAGSLRYTGSAARTFLGIMSVSLAASSNNTETFMTIGVDGSALTRLEVDKNIGTSNDEIEVHGLLRLANGERVGPMMRGDAAAASGWALKRMVFTVKE